MKDKNLTQSIKKEEEDISIIRKRIEKAIEIKKTLINLNISDEICLDLKIFSKILNDWVKDGKYVEGKIKLPEINRKLVYQLASPKYTVVKLIVL